MVFDLLCSRAAEYNDTDCRTASNAASSAGRSARCSLMRIIAFSRSARSLSCCPSGLFSSGCRRIRSIIPSVIAGTRDDGSFVNHPQVRPKHDRSVVLTQHGSLPVEKCTVAHVREVRALSAQLLREFAVLLDVWPTGLRHHPLDGGKNPFR